LRVEQLQKLVLELAHRVPISVANCTYIQTVKQFKECALRAIKVAESKRPDVDKLNAIYRELKSYYQ